MTPKVFFEWKRREKYEGFEDLLSTLKMNITE